MQIPHSVAEFYDYYSTAWDNSRNAPWPGWQIAWEQVSKDMPQEFSCLDLGCGNGRFLKFLLETLADEHSLIDYLGVDISRQLLNIAKGKYAQANSDNKQISFVQQDLSQEFSFAKKFNLASALAIFHHLPDQRSRIKLITSCAKALQLNGYLIFSLWDFWQDPANSKRVVKPKDITGPGDYWLSWSTDKARLRFVHAFSETEKLELLAAAEKLGFRLVSQFKADGKNAKLNQYYILQLTSAYS